MSLSKGVILFISVQSLKLTYLFFSSTTLIVSFSFIFLGSWSLIIFFLFSNSIFFFSSIFKSCLIAISSFFLFSSGMFSNIYFTNIIKCFKSSWAISELINSLNTKTLTLARKLSEHLLGFLIEEDSCPIIKISIIWNWKEDTIILNEYIKWSDTKIENIWEEKIKFSCIEDDFKLFVFKFYYPENQKSSINLIAHNRVVTSNSLDKYIPEFKEEFYDEIEKRSSNWTKKENFVIKVYVKWNYLDESVNTERTWFNFPMIKSENIAKIINTDEIEKESIEAVKKFFPEKLNERKLKKIESVKSIVNNNFPWHKTLLKEWTNEENVDSLPYNPSEQDVDIFFEKIRFNKEWKARSVVRWIHDWKYSEENIGEKIKEIDKELLDLNKSELVHYVSLRKVILELYQKFISFNDDWEYLKEEKIHNLIFPMWQNNTNTEYSEHNLWLIDENLVFSDYITSDNAIKAEDNKKTEPDLLIFRDWKENILQYILSNLKDLEEKTTLMTL